jgi:hypothetical protein
MQLVQNMNINGLGFNLSPDDSECCDESYLDIVVDGFLKCSKRVVVLSQRVQRFKDSEVHVGFLVIALGGQNRWFWINPWRNDIDGGNIE